MALLSLDLTNMVLFIANIAPVFLALFLMFLSAYNSDIKIIFLLAGGLITWFINGIIQNQEIPQLSQPLGRQASCNLFSYITTPNSSPPIATALISFAFTYVLLASWIKYGFTNGWLVAFFVIMLSGDYIIKARNKCNNNLAIITAIGIGLVVGYCWWSILDGIPAMQNYLYFTDSGDTREVCSRPSKQTFKCKVYKNGEMIGTV